MAWSRNVRYRDNGHLQPPDPTGTLLNFPKVQVCQVWIFAVNHVITDNPEPGNDLWGRNLYREGGATRHMLPKVRSCPSQMEQDDRFH